MGDFCHKRLVSKRQFDRRSFRTIKRGRRLIRVACPRGQWKNGRCRVGMQAQAILARKDPRGRCPRGYKKKGRSR